MDKGGEVSPPSKIKGRQKDPRAQCFQLRTGAGGLWTEWVLASRYLRKTRGGSANPLAMMRGGSVHPFCRAIDSSGERGSSVGVARHDCSVATVCGRKKGERLTSWSDRGDAANGATGSRGVKPGALTNARGVRGVPKPEFHVTSKAKARSPAFCSLWMRWRQKSLSRAWLSMGRRDIFDGAVGPNALPCAVFFNKHRPQFVTADCLRLLRFSDLFFWRVSRNL